MSLINRGTSRNNSSENNFVRFVFSHHLIRHYLLMPMILPSERGSAALGIRMLISFAGINFHHEHGKTVFRSKPKGTFRIRSFALKFRHSKASRLRSS